MGKVLAFLSLFAIVATYSGCQDRRQEEQEKSTEPIEKEAPKKPNQMDKGFDGREMGGGGGNAK